MGVQSVLPPSSNSPRAASVLPLPTPCSGSCGGRCYGCSAAPPPRHRRLAGPPRQGAPVSPRHQVPGSPRPSRAPARPARQGAGGDHAARRRRQALPRHDPPPSTLQPQKAPARGGGMSQLGRGAHQKNTREQRFAFCSGLGFTSAYPGSILPPGSRCSRRRGRGCWSSGGRAGPLGGSPRTTRFRELSAGGPPRSRPPGRAAPAAGNLEPGAWSDAPLARRPDVGGGDHAARTPCRYEARPPPALDEGGRAELVVRRAHVLLPGCKLCRSPRSRAPRRSCGGEALTLPTQLLGNAPWAAAFRTRGRAARPLEPSGLAALIRTKQGCQRESQTFDLGQEQDLARIIFVELQDLKKGNRIERNPLIWEGECTLSSGAGFLHLTCCVARRSSCQLLLPSETGKGGYVRKRAGLISFIMPSEPGRINVAERTPVTALLGTLPHV